MQYALSRKIIQYRYHTPKSSTGNRSNTEGATYEAGIVYPSGAP